MEVLVLVDFEGDAGDELTVRMGDVVANVTKASEDGWLEGELRGKRGIFPANFTKEVPVYLIGSGEREPRSIRQTKKMKHKRMCEVAFSYEPVNQDELQLVVGETIEIVKEIEDGWWMGVKNGKVGAFPSNFVKEIFVTPKDGKYSEGKTRPKLSNAVFSKEISQRTSVRSKIKNVVECCQVMFNYEAKTDDELSLKKGDLVVVLRKETEDEGWWEGELNGRCGFFPDNFVMLIPPMNSLQSGTLNQPPARNHSTKVPETTEGSAMEKVGPAKIKDDKQVKDLRSNPPNKIKLPSFNKPSPPPVKDKPAKASSNTNGDAASVSPEEKDDGGDRFDGVDVQTEKLCHPTANRAKPPHRRPPSGLVTGAEGAAPELPPKMTPPLTTTTPTLPARPPPPRVPVASKGVTFREDVTVESLQAEIRELKMSLELLQRQHDRDMQEVREELREEGNKRVALQEEVHNMRKE
ncbi:SH3 domain-containing protein 21 isoform X2 [Pungitius pungitius]|uniref:SH3 domain-containing protein 21 isoform X2 n=1 Tax=Pungitius pungitius TaxID=134920 RepID=UPI002E1276C2